MLRNVNIFLACESAGGGWSTLGGSVVRFNMVDDAGTFATMDYPLHDAGDFDTITATWIHVVLVVDAKQILTFDDGKMVPDSEYGFFALSAVVNSPNAAYPHPGQLTHPMGGTTIDKSIHIGARSDRNSERHFVGRMAGLLVSKVAFSSAQAECIFKNGEEFLPVELEECKVRPTELAVSFLGSANDTSGHNRSVVLQGQPTVTAGGVRFDGQDDCISVPNFEYAGDASFTVSFWMTKEDCTANVYEYLYSHHKSDTKDGLFSDAFVDVYLACESMGSGWSTHSGTVLGWHPFK